MNGPRYFLRHASEDSWTEVTVEEFVRAERMAGFHNTLGRPDLPATSSFGAGPVQGRTVYGEGTP